MADIALVDVPHVDPDEDQRSAIDEPTRRPRREHAPRRGVGTYVLRTFVIVYLFFLVAWPVSLVAQRTFEGGLENLRGILEDPAAMQSIRLTVVVAAIAVVINTVFGVAISLLLVRYEFRGKRLLSALVDLPLAVSPVVVGLALVLVYGGRGGWFGPTLESAGFQVIYATPGIVMATVFVALPLVIREVAPVLEEVGTDAERAAHTLGANAWQTFWRITLPSIRWGLTYGVVLTVARTLGEFGAVLMVSSNLPGQSQTLTLLVHDRYTLGNPYGAYTISVVLMAVALIVLVAQILFDAQRSRVKTQD